MFNICIIKPSKYIHSDAYLEIAELLNFSILELKKKSSIVYNFIDTNSNTKNIIFGAHLLNEELIKSIPKNSIVFNTEQLESINEMWKKRIIFFAEQGVELWDYSSFNLDFLKQKLKIKGKLFEIGYQHKLQRIKSKNEKEIDVLFYGSINKRRKQIIDKLLKNKIKVKCLFGIYGKERDEWISRSKIVLNLHMYESKIFEIIRVFYLLTNGISVISEFDKNTKFNTKLINGVKHCTYDEIEKNIIFLLENDKERLNLGINGNNLIKKYPQEYFTKSILEL